MNRKEQIRLALICNGRTLMEGNKCVAGSRQDYFGAHPSLHEFRQPQRHVENNFLLHYAIGPNRSVIVAAVPGIDYNAIHLQPQRPR